MIHGDELTCNEQFGVAMTLQTWYAIQNSAGLLNILADAFRSFSIFCLQFSGN